VNVLLISPGYPAEMPLFTRAYAQRGAAIFGVSDVVEDELPPLAREHLSGYLQVPLRDDARVIEMVRAWRPVSRFDHVISMWEPAVMLAARLREALGIEGMRTDQATLFRSKDRMKEAVAGAGIRTPRHEAARSADEVRTAAHRLEFPIVVKPVAGAGSVDTFRIDDAAALEHALDRLRLYDVVNVEEFIDGEEYTFDAISAHGEILYFNVCHYRPRPLVARTLEWISGQTIALRDLTRPELAEGIAMGRAVLRALHFESGFTHMEWFRTSGGETVFSEIAARPPGARTVDLMNYVSDADFFDGCAEAELEGTLSQPTERRYNAINIFKRASGQGSIERIEGLDRIMQRLGDALMVVDLLPVGAPRRDWIQTLIGDGYVCLRHPDLDTAMELADYVGTELRMYAR
jgi:hypothetical protein